MKNLKRLMLACLLVMLSSTTNAAVTYLQNFDSGTDAWETVNSVASLDYSTLAHAVGVGQSGNSLQVNDGGYNWAASKNITGLVAGESWTLSAYVNLPHASWVNSTTDPKMYIRFRDAGGAYLGAATRGDQITTVGSWVQTTMSGTVPANATQAHIGFGDSRPSTASTVMYIDTVSFTSEDLSAADRTWTGLGADDNISTVGNWDTGVPVAADRAIFDGSTRLTPSLDSSLTVAKLTFTNGAGAFSISRPGSEVLTLTGDILNTSANSQTIGAAVTLSGAGRTVDTGANGISLTAGLTAASGFTKVGAGTLSVSGGAAGSVAGTVTISGGTLALGTSDQIADTAILDVASGAVFDLGGNTDTIGQFSASSTTAAGQIQLGAGQLTIATAATGAGSFYAGDILGSAGSKFIKAGAGEIRLYKDTMVNTFEKLEVQAGTFRLGHGAAPNGTDAMLGAVPVSFMQDQITLSGGTLSLNGSNATSRIDVDANRGITLSGNATIETLVPALIPGKITGSGTLTKSGGVDLELTGLNDFSGGLTLGGPVTLGNASAAGTGPIKWNATAAILSVSAESLVITNHIDLTAVVNNKFGGTTNFTLSGDVDLGNTGTSPRLNVLDAGATVTLSGALTNTLGLTINGAGTVVLTGANTYEGATEVTGGTLRVSGSSPTSTNTVLVNSDGVLAGTGNILGTLTIGSAGTLSVGTSPGTLNTADLVWDGGGTNIVEVNDATGTAGSDPGWDLVNVTGTLTINATVGSKFTINAVSLTGGNVPGVADNFSGATDYDWNIVTTTGGITGYDAAAFSVPTNNFLGIPDGGSFTVLQVGNNLVLRYSLSNPPLVTSDPVASQTVVSGTEVVLSATVTGTEPLVYRWEKDSVLVTDGGDISGATTPTLTLANTVPGSSGSYVLIVTNAVGSDSTDPSVLTVLDPVVVTVDPAGATIGEGTNFNPTATVTGGGTITYQWKKDGVDLVDGGNITGANTASLLITATTVLQAGSYTLAVTNEVSDDLSAAAVLIVQAPPVITVQPQSVATTDGATANFSVTATGHDLEYQWSRNGVDIGGATDSSYSVAASASSIGYYSVTISNNLGTATSDTVTLSVDATTTFFDNFDSYADQTAFNASWSSGATAAVLGSALSVSAPNSIAQTTAANQSYKFFGPVSGNSMRFKFDMYDPAANNSGRSVGMVYSRAGTLWTGGLNQILAIGRYNNGGATKYYGRVAFATGATYTDGASAPNATWFQLTGAPNTSVGWHEMEIVSEADPNNVGKQRYSFYVDGVLGGRVNNVAPVDFNWVVAGSGLSSTGAGASFDNYEVTVPAPDFTITAQPENISTNAGATAVFSVTAPGATIYQWKKDGSDISGATDSSLTLNNVLKADEGSYSVYLENGFSITTSDAATLTVADPYISTQPVGLTNGLGTNAVFTVVAAGTPAVTYQWKKDGIDLVDGGHISGANTDELTVAAIGVSDAGDYTVAVTNGLGDGVISDVATLATIQPPTIDAHPASVVFLHQGQSAQFSVAASGVQLAYQWRTNGTAISGATDTSYTWLNAQPADTALQFSVEVSNPAGSVISSDASILLVQVDTIAPKVTVTSPKKSKGTNLAEINVTGIVKDTGTGNSGIISSVKFGHNGGNVLTGPVTNETVLTDLTKGAWSFATAAPITLTPGTNIIHVVATDLAGNTSTLLPFIFYYDLTNDLVLTIVGEGQVKMGTNLWNASQTIPNLFKVGRPYKIDAFVGKGTNFIFTNWVTGPVDVGTSTNNWAQKSKLSFIMQEDMTITATFATNQFSGVAGTYNGLFSEAGGVTHETAGYIQVKVKDKSAYSGYLLFDGVKRPFSGKLKTDGTVSAQVIRSKGLTPQPPVNITLAVNLDPQAESLTGTVSATNGSWTAEILTDKLVYTKVGPFDTNSVGLYTVQIPTGPGAPTGSPGGVGYGSVTNSPDGFAKLTGALGDGTKVSSKLSLSRHGNWPLYVGLYKHTTTKDFKGSVQGWVKFTTNNFGPSEDNVLNWIKKEGSMLTTYYPDGFSNSVELAGAPYVPVVTPGQLPIPLNVGDHVIVSDGGLEAPVTNVVTIITNTATATKVLLNATNTANVVNKATISFKLKDGTFSGAFLNPITPTTKTLGAVLQGPNTAKGFFLGTNGQTGTISVEPATP